MSCFMSLDLVTHYSVAMLVNLNEFKQENIRLVFNEKNLNKGCQGEMN